MGWARAQGTTGISGFAAPQGEGHGFDPAQGCEGMWLPTYLGSSLAAWYKADAGCYTDAAMLCASASTQYARNSSSAIAVGSGDAYWAGWVYLTTNTGNPMFFGKYGAPLDLGFIVFYYSGIGFTIDASDDGAAFVEVSDPTVRAAGAWYFIEAKYTRQTRKAAIAVNGGTFTESAALATPGIFVSSRAFAIGDNSSGLGYLDGAAARLGMWQRLPTAAERTWLYNAGAGRFYADLGVAGTDGSDLKTSLVEYWNLCESSSTRVGSHAGLNLTPTNGPTVAAGPGEGACVDNSPVKRWEDQSGNARHLVQTTIANQPLWIASAQNGKPAVRTDGTDDYLKATFAQTQPLTLMCAAKFATGGATVSARILFGGHTAAAPAILYQKTTGEYSMYGGSAEVAGAATSDTAWHQHSVVMNGASSARRLDGAADGSAGDPGPTGIEVALSVGAYGDASAAKDADVGEAILVDAVLSSTPAEGYLKSRWATP